MHDTTVEIPVSVTRGAAGTTTLSENIAALPATRYRVEKYLVADPADVDGDCIDDLTELADPAGNPVNSAKAPDPSDGAVVIPDRAAFEALVTGGYLKFIMVDLDTERPGVYFMNTNKHPSHEDFLEALGIDEGPGVAVGRYGLSPVPPCLRWQRGTLPSVSQYFGGSVFSGNFPLNTAAHVYTLLAANMPLLDDDLGLFISNTALPAIQVRLASRTGPPASSWCSRKTPSPGSASKP